MTSIRVPILFLAISSLCSGCAGLSAQPNATATDMPNEGPVGAVMQRNSEQFANCARDSITVQTGSTLKLRLKFTVTPEGRAMNPQILNLREPDPDLRLCLIRVIKRIEFPKPADKLPKEINYPITLKAD